MMMAIKHKPRGRGWKARLTYLCKRADELRHKPEGEITRQQIIEIMNRHPEAALMDCVIELGLRDIEFTDATLRIAAYRGSLEAH